MLTISCSNIETARNNPIQYGEILAIQDSKPAGGHGMFSYWKEAVVRVLKDEVTMHAAKKELQRAFERFVNNEKNSTKQKLLLAKFGEYFKNHEEKKFRLHTGAKSIKWNLIASVRLTGFTPIVVSDPNSTFSSYLFLEEGCAWKSQIKFPLMQSYLANDILQCDINQLKIGIYCLKTNSFELKHYNKVEIASAVEEAKSIFQIVENVYRGKKGS